MKTLQTNTRSDTPSLVRRSGDQKQSIETESICIKNSHILVLNLQVSDKRVVVETFPVKQQANRTCVDVLLFAILALQHPDASFRFHIE